MPDQSLELGWSSITTHWLSDVPVRGVSALVDVRDVPELARAFAAQARADWENFVGARANELVVGGHVVMVEPCQHTDGTNGCEATTEIFHTILHQFIDEGILTGGQVAEIDNPSWLRTPESYLEEIERHPDLQLVRSEVCRAPVNPLEQAFSDTGDASAFAKAMTGATRGWSESIYFGHLEDSEAIADEFYARFEGIGAADPDLLLQQTWHLTFEFERVR